MYRSLISRHKVNHWPINNEQLVRQCLASLTKEQCQQWAREGWTRLNKAEPIVPELPTAMPQQIVPAEDVMSQDDEDEDVPIVHANKAYTAIVATAVEEHLLQPAA